MDTGTLDKATGARPARLRNYEDLPGPARMPLVGNLLLLRHADGWMSAYAHLDEIQVDRGQTVQRGQAIGRLGQTGSVSSPQLHFELRRAGKAVDPREYLGPPQTARAE